MEQVRFAFKDFTALVSGGAMVYVDGGYSTQ